MSLMQVHLKERMHALEEKNNLSTELHQTRKKLEELANQKVRIQIISLKAVLRIRIRIRIRRIRMFLGLLDPDPLVRGMDLDPSPPDPDSSIFKQK
jgi:hypothetical protein